jgi:hypothetical protein
LADQRITQLTALSKAGVAANDVLPISDISASETKKVTAKDLIAAGIDLVDNGEIDLAKLDQASATKLGATALATGAITAAKLAADSSIAVQTTSPTTDNFEGRGYFNSSTGNLQVFNGSAYQQLVVPTAGIGDLQVTTGKLADGAVTTAKVTALGTAAYADSSVTTAKIADSAITAAKIAADSITAAQLAPSAIGASELADNAVDTAAIVNLAVTGAKLADGAVTTAKLGDLAVTDGKIASGTISYGKLNLADGSVPGAKLAADSVTSAQIAAAAVTTSELADGSVTTAKIAAGAVTAAKIAADAITSAQIAPDAVGASELANDAVDTAAIVNSAVTSAKIGDGAVATAKLADLAVTDAKIAAATISYSKLNLADGSVPGAKIAADSITTTQIGAAAVGTSELVDGSVTTAKLAAGAVTAGKIAADTITAAEIAAGAIGTSELAGAAVTYDKIQNTSTNDVLLGRSSAGGGVIQEIPATSAGRGMLAAASASAQRSLLGLGDLATVTGTWVNGSSFSGTSSGTNTGDQTITLTGDVTGSGTGSFAATIANSAITEAKIATNAVTTGKIFEGSVTGIKLANNSAAVVAATVPAGNGAFIGQQWINTNTAIEYTWDGSTWVRQASLGALLTFAETTPLNFAVAYPDPYTATITVGLDTQAANRAWMGPTTGVDATPTFRALVPADLPDATASTKGIVQPGSGLSVTSGTLNHSNSTTAGTYTKLTVDAQGHVTAGALLSASDVPSLDASKITSGTFGTAFLADDAVTGLKLANYSTAKVGEVLPTADYIGQIFLNPLDKAFFMWDGNVWQPIGISAGSVIFAGTYNASTNQVATVTTEGTAIGLSVGNPLPAASNVNESYYVVVSTGGTGSSPAPAVALAPPDLILSNGSAWVEIDVSSTYVAQTAANVGFTPAANLGSTNVQAALEEVSNECRNADNITSGTLLATRGGTGTGSYTKGDLLAASSGTALSKLGVGSNGQVLRANSATATGLEWGNDFVGTVTTVSSSTAALTVATATTTPALTIRSATTSVDGIVQLSDSTSTSSSALAATSTAVKSAYDLAAAALPKAGGTMTGTLELGAGVNIVFEGATGDTFETTLTCADPTADRTITLPNRDGTVAVTADLDDGTF